MATVGIVCEGSHDYEFLCPIIDELLRQQGVDENRFSALQPQIDATSCQVDGGGYEAVLQWIKAKSGEGLEKYFVRTLFQTSEIYDFVVLHLDGDVAEISTEFLQLPYSSFDGSVLGRVRALHRWLFELANVDVQFRDRIVTAIPTLQMEAWVIACLRPGQVGLENHNRKRAAKRLLWRTFGGRALDQVSQAAELARGRIASMCNDAQSFSIFRDQIAAATPADIN